MASFFIICGYNLKSYFIPKINIWEGWNNGKKRSLFFGISVIVFLILATFFGPGNFSLSDYGHYGILGFFSFCFLGILKTYLLSEIMSCKFIGTRMVKVFAYIGRQSLRLMCIHIIVFMYLDVVSSGNYPISFLGMIISLCISVCFGHVSCRYSHNPILRYI